MFAAGNVETGICTKHLHGIFICTLVKRYSVNGSEKTHFQNMFVCFAFMFCSTNVGLKVTIGFLLVFPNHRLHLPLTWPGSPQRPLETVWVGILTDFELPFIV